MRLFLIIALAVAGTYFYIDVYGMPQYFGWKALLPFCYLPLISLFFAD